MVQDTHQPEQMPFSEKEWAQTPPAVQEFVLALITRVQELKLEVAALREQVNRNSRNSSNPPSSNGPDVPAKPGKHAKDKRKRGGQPVVAEVVEYRLHVLTCPECGTETCAELPPGVAQGAFGPRLQAMVSLLSGRYHLSKRDTEEVMDDFFRADITASS